MNKESFISVFLAFLCFVAVYLLFYFNNTFWLSTLLLYLGLILSSIFLIDLFKLKKGVKLSSIVFWVILFSSDLIINFIGKYDTYNESIGNLTYVSPYNKISQSNHAKSIEKCIELSEFTHCRIYNSYGFPTKEFDKNKGPREVRAFILGDSFTEGIGTIQKKSWPNIFQNLYRVESYDANFYNLGLSGSYSKTYLNVLNSDVILYNPDYLFIAFNSSDIEDIIIFELLKTPPWFEWLFASSHIIRKTLIDLFQLNWMLLSGEENKIITEKAVTIFLDDLQKIKNKLTNLKIDYFFIFHPLKDEAISNQFRYALFEKLTGELNHISILEEFHNKVNGNQSKYFWKKDTHCKANGYLLMAEIIKSKVGKLKQPEIIAQ